jgi:hypothetical protein
VKPPARRPGRGRRPWSPLPCLALWLVVWPAAPANPALAAPALLEDLHYRVAVLAWEDAARVRLTLKSLGPGRFAVEATGETRGFIKFLTGERRERLQTEMVWRNHRLVPLVYREESFRHGKHRLKEYRFDYSRGRLEMWQSQDGQGLVKKWQTELHDQVYDPLTAFYNCRLKILGPTQAGATGTIPGIPYPRPENMEMRLGVKTPEGCQAMVSLVNSVFGDSRGEVFARLDERLVPRRVWTTVYGITVSGLILPDSLLLPPGLTELPGPGIAAAR